MDPKKAFRRVFWRDFKMLESEEALENSKSEMLEEITINRC